jgi:DNA polymerase III delta subunit
MIIFIYGADTYRSRQKLNELKDKFVTEIDINSQSLIVISGAATTLKEIGEKINTGSLFVKKRMIIIEDIFDNKSDKLLADLTAFLKKKDEAAKSDEDNIIIFRDGDLNNKDKKLKKDAQKLFTFLLSQKYVQEFKTLSGAQLTDFIKEAVQKLERRIEAVAINSLVARTNSDLWRISSELHKLAMAISKDETINDQEVKNQVVGTYDENIFSLTDAIAARNQKLALTILEEQYMAGLSEDYILSMLIRQFKIMLQVKSAVAAGLSPNQIATDLKLHAYVVKKSLAQISGFTQDTLKEKLNHLISLDFANKTRQKDIKAELSLFISKL